MALTDADRLQMTAIALMKHNHVLSGAVYEPVIYNDEGVYNYFYIDFLKAVAPFSLGMWNESIIIYGNSQIIATEIRKINEHIYKVYCNCSTETHGIAVINKDSSLLKWAIGGAKLPVFSVMFYVAGLNTYVRKAYTYEKMAIGENATLTAVDDGNLTFSNYTNVTLTKEIITTWPTITAFESTNISYWTR